MARPGTPLLARGTVLAGIYHVEDPLARGGTGEIYIAWDSHLQREVAVKVLLPRHAADPRLASRFHQEARAMARVRHANVVKVITTGRQGGLPFIVMEYVPGQTVAALIRESCRRGELLGLGTVSHILRQAARGLTAIQDRGLFHGDVKPSNMLIDPDLQVTISDFGMVGSSTDPVAFQSGFPGGTPLYIAPELACGADVPPEKRHLCDLYSLGVSVFEMLTGYAPFVASTVHDILRGHLFEPAPRVRDRRPELPREIEAVMARALAKTPALRFQSYAELSAEVERVAELARSRRSLWRRARRRSTGPAVRNEAGRSRRAARLATGG